MKKLRWYLILAALIIASLLVLPGCIKVSTGTKKPSPPVSGTTPVTPQPGAAIPAAGTPAPTPEPTPILNTPSNGTGTATSVPASNFGAPGDLPDLVITDAWLQGSMIYYKVKNAGMADSPPTYTNLWVQNLSPAMGSSSFVDVLKPGQEKTLTFSSYQWPYGADTGDLSLCVYGADSGRYLDPTCLNYMVKVCADAKDESNEASEANNCMNRIWGQLFDYNLIPYAHLATWRTSSGESPTQGVEGSQTGAYIKMSDGGLEMVPDQAPGGWIQGNWGFFYTDPEFRVARTAAIKVPPGLHFVSRVGLAPNATGSDGVTFKLGIRDMSDQTNFLPGKTMNTPGVYESWDIDLKDYVGQKIFFVLRVEAMGSPTSDFAVWKEARLMQVNE
jgi:hypothetical protein